MIHRLVVCVTGMLLVVSASASAQETRETTRPWWATAAISTHAASHAFDMITTNRALAVNPNATEMNPVLRPFVDNPTAFKAISMSLWVGANYTLWRVSKSHPKRATVVAIALSAAEIAIASHNVSIANAQPTVARIR